MDSNIELLLSLNDSVCKYGNTLLKYETPIEPVETDSYISSTNPQIGYLEVDCYNNTIPAIVRVTTHGHSAYYAYLDYVDNQITYVVPSNMFSCDGISNIDTGNWQIIFSANANFVNNLATIEAYNYFKYVPAGNTLITIPQSNNTILATTIKGPGWYKSGDYYYPEQGLCVPMHTEAITYGPSRIPANSCTPIFGIGTWNSMSYDSNPNPNVLTANNFPLVNDNNHVLSTPKIWRDQGVLHWDPTHWMPIYISAPGIKIVHDIVTWDISGTNSSAVTVSDLLHGRADLSSTTLAADCVFLCTGGESWVTLDGYGAVTKGDADVLATLSSLLTSEDITKGGWLHISSDDTLPGNKSNIDFNEDEIVAYGKDSGNDPYFITKYGNELIRYTSSSSRVVDLTSSGYPNATYDIWTANNETTSSRYYRLTLHSITGKQTVKEVINAALS